MWNRNYGLLLVWNAENRIVGVVTNRYTRTALGSRGITAGQLRLSSLVSNGVFWCLAEDEIHTALATMATEKVRRLVVLDEGRLQGILSMDDIVRHAAQQAEGTWLSCFTLMWNCLSSVLRTLAAAFWIARASNEGSHALQ